MPVIREDRKFGIQPIGVVRASQGGQITAEAVAKSAATLGNTLNKKAARYAEKTGTEMAQAAARQDIVGIDPNTGGPIALTQTAKMGTIQADAYERIVLRRFETSIEEDLSLKSAEIALSNQNENAYANIFSEYIAEMSNNATGLYAEYIKNTGEAIQHKTRLTLREQAIRRAQAQAARDAEGNLERGINYSYSIGMTASQNADSGLGINQLYQMLQLNEAQINDLNDFNVETFQFTESQNKLVSSYITGRIAGAAFEMPKSDIDGLERILLTSPDAPVVLQSDQAKAIHEEIRRLTMNGNLTGLGDVAKSLSTTFTRARSTARESEVSFETLTTNFSSNNNSFNLQISEGYYSNFAMSDIGTRFDALKAMQDFSVDQIGANNQNTGLINSRIGYLKSASEELVSAAIVKMALASNYDAAGLVELQRELTVENIQPLLNRYKESNPDADQSIGGQIANLFSQVGRDGISSALEVISSEQTYLAAKEAAVIEEADLAMNDTAVAESVARVADNPDLLGIEMAKWAPYAEGTKHADVVSQLQYAAKTSGVRASILALDTERTPDVLDELRLMAGGIVDPSNAPLLDGLGLYDQVKTMFDGVDQGDRTKIVSGLIDSLPNLDRITAAQYKSNVDDIQASIREKSVDYSRMTADEIVQSGVNLAEAIDSNVNLTDEDRISLKLEAAKTVTAELMLKVSQEGDEVFVTSVSRAISIGNADGIVGLTDEQKDLINSYIGNLPQSERSDIASTFESALSKRRANEEAIATQTMINNVESAVQNGLPLTSLNSAQSSEATRFLRESNDIGATEVIPNVFRNAQAYTSQQVEEGQPDYGKFYQDSIDAARRGHVIPELSSTLSSATIPGSLSQTELASVVGTWDSIANQTDPATARRIRSDIVNNSSLSEIEIAILDTMVLARNSGSERLLPDILAYNGKASEIEAAIGMTLDEFVRGAVDAGVGNRNLWANNPNIREPLRLRAQGLFVSGRLTERQINADLFAYSRSMFVEDDLVINTSNPTADLHLVSFRQSFGNNDLSIAAAIELTNIEYAYTLGLGIVGRDASADEIIDAGFSQMINENIQTPKVVGRDFSFVSSPSPLVGYFEDKVELQSGTSTKFSAAPSATTANPLFYLQQVDAYGQTSIVSGITPINPTNPVYQQGARILQEISASDPAREPYSRRGRDALINLFKNSRGLE